MAMDVVNMRRLRVPVSDLSEPDWRFRISDLAAVGDGRSHGSTIRNKSIGTEMFFNSVGASFSKRASSALRIWRSTSIETQIPPAPANDSIRDAMFTPSP